MEQLGFKKHLVLLASRRDRLRVILSTCISIWWGCQKEIKITELESSQMLYSGRSSYNRQKGKYRTPYISIRGKKTPTKWQPPLLWGWPNIRTTCPEWFPEEVLPQLNLVNHFTGVLYLRATTSPFLKEHCLLPSKLQQSTALTDSSQEQNSWSIK